MKILSYFGVILLTGLVSTAPTSNNQDNDVSTSDKVIINKDFFLDQFNIYTAEHEIVNILLPLNDLNFAEDDDDDNDDDAVNSIIFFALADTVNGKQESKGIYIRKKGQVTKLLENGSDFASDNENTTVVYIAAKDGIYYYNNETNKAEKYGSIDDSIINIAKVNGSDILYILTEDHVLYKVTEEGTKKEKIEGVANALQIILDFENNLYYYTPEKNVYVLSSDGAVKKIEGLPEASYIKLLRPPFVLGNGIPVILDEKSYIVSSDGKSELTDFEFQTHPTAYSMEATLVQYYAYDKKIYEYNILTLLLGELLSTLKEFLESKSDTISEIATRSRSDLRA